eukprot:COSAG01_NODE_37248_length_506_cov_0.847666_2_plen_64_part_01
MVRKPATSYASLPLASACRFLILMPCTSFSLPLPDPDGEEGGVDTTQCRGIRLGGVCEVTCDAN